MLVLVSRLAWALKLRTMAFVPISSTQTRTLLCPHIHMLHHEKIQRVECSCSIYMAEIWGYTLPYKSGEPKSTFFPTTSQFNANFNGLYLPSEPDIYTIGQVRWKLQGVSYVVSKCHERWSTNGLKLDRRFKTLNFAKPWSTFYWS